MPAIQQLRPLLRVWALLSVLGLACTLVLGARAKAEGEHALYGLADHMMRFAGALSQTTPVELKLNGASLFLSNASVQAPVSEVLDRFAAKCAEKNGQLERAWGDAAALSGRTLSGLSGIGEASGVLDGVLRNEVDGAGYVVCFEAPDGSRLTPAELVERVARFAETGDIADVGHLRYVRVTRAESHADRSFFVAVWSEGALPIYEMFPEHGDAPGRDPEGLPRPSGVRRILSSEQLGQDVLVTMYASEQGSRADLQRFYTTMLEQRGYTLLGARRSMSEPLSEQILFAKNERADRLVTVAFTEDDAGKGIATLSTRPD